ncbi:MAG: glycoside hydrolase, partial [Acidobacteriaceae bacterium]|nr:glycoside hydrolase [Acidobacteriaceae bacterium]
MFSIAAVAQQNTGSERAKQDGLRFRFVGPQVGNRISAVAAVPGDPSVYYAGAASGGVWKSTDGGNKFQAIFDDQPAAAIGALTIAPSDPSTVWAGTGEAWAIRDSDVMGDGVYRSLDAGKTWKHMGLDETGRIGRIVVNPQNPD